MPDPAPMPATPQLNLAQRAGGKLDALATTLKQRIAQSLRGVWEFVGSHQVRNALLLLLVFVIGGFAQMFHQMTQAARTIAETQALYGEILRSATSQRGMPGPPTATPQAIAPERLMPGPWRPAEEPARPAAQPKP